MASVIKDPGGKKRIQWCVGTDRRTLRLGNVTLRQADAVKVRIEQVLSSQSTGVLDTEAARWLESIDDDMHRKLSRLGLVQPRAGAGATLTSLMDAYFRTLTVKPGTRRTYQQARTSLEAHFGASCALDAITALGGEEWRKSMQDEELAPATIAKRVKTAKHIFDKAVKWKMLPENPVSDLKVGSMSNRSRMVFISGEMTDKVLAECDTEWKVIVAMARYGGIRVPSELLPLRWTDIDFDKGHIHITSPKTEGYAGKDSRMIPLFEELRPILMAAFEEAQDGAEFVVTRYRHSSANLRTQLHRIIKRAGLVPWAKPFVNMRSSRATELAETYPQAVLTQWLGHSVTVSVSAYQQVLPEHHARAIGDVAGRVLAAASGRVAAGSAPGRGVGQRGADGASVAA